jgi:hypothetical protein
MNLDTNFDLRNSQFLYKTLIATVHHTPFDRDLVRDLRGATAISSHGLHMPANITLPKSRNKHNQPDTHFTFTYTLLRFKVSTCFGYYLPIFRRHYTNADLVTIVCSCRCGLVSGCGKTSARNISRLWTLIKCKCKWNVYQVGCVYYVITSLWCTVNKTLNS